MIPADLGAERQRVLGLIQETTPGEWLREDGLVNGFVFALNEAGTNRMALSISCGLLDNGMRALPKEVHANSALIAAAPDLARQLVEALGELERVKRMLDTERFSHSNTIDARDAAQKAADELAYLFFDIDDIGEHSSSNCPWHEALELLSIHADSIRSALAPAPEDRP